MVACRIQMFGQPSSARSALRPVALSASLSDSFGKAWVGTASPSLGVAPTLCEVILELILYGLPCPGYEQRSAYRNRSEARARRAVLVGSPDFHSVLRII